MAHLMLNVRRSLHLAASADESAPNATPFLVDPATMPLPPTAATHNNNTNTQASMGPGRDMDNEPYVGGREARHGE